MDSQQIEEEVEKNRRRFFRARSNTGALVAREGSHDGKLFILANRRYSHEYQLVSPSSAFKEG